MENLLFFNFNTSMVWGLATGTLIILPVLFLVKCYFYWSEPDRPGGPIFFVKAKENMAMFVMISNKLKKVILASRKTIIDNEFNVKELPTHSKSYKQGQKGFWGMFWIGIWPIYKIHEIHLVWQEWKSLPKNSSKPEEGFVNVLITRDERMLAFPIKALNFGMIVPGAEDKNHTSLNLPIDLIILARNVEKMIFSNIDVYGQLRKIVETIATMFIKEESFYSLGDEKLEEDKNKNFKIINDKFSEVICALNQSIPSRSDKKGLIEVLGIEIVSAQMKSPEITGDTAVELLKATNAKFIADELAKGIVVEAEGYKKAKIIRAEGDKIAGMLGIDVEKYDMKIRRAFYQKIESMPYAQQIELARKMFTDSNLTTFVSGKDVTPTVNLTEGGK